MHVILEHIYIKSLHKLSTQSIISDEYINLVPVSVLSYSYVCLIYYTQDSTRIVDVISTVHHE